MSRTLFVNKPFTFVDSKKKETEYKKGDKVQESSFPEHIVKVYLAERTLVSTPVKLTPAEIEKQNKQATPFELPIVQGSSNSQAGESLKIDPSQPIDPNSLKTAATIEQEQEEEAARQPAPTPQGRKRR